MVELLGVIPIKDGVHLRARLEQWTRIPPSEHHHLRAEARAEQRAERKSEYHITDAIGATDENAHAGWAGRKSENRGGPGKYTLASAVLRGC